MTQITQAYWLAVQRQVSVYKADVQKALLKAFDEIAGKLNERELARLVETGGVDRLVSQMLPAEDVKAAFKGVNTAMTKVTKRSADNTVKLLPKDARGIAVAFDTLNPDVINAVDKLNTRVMQDLITETRESVRTTVKEGIEAGLPAKAIAKDIRESVGLAPNQAKAVRNFENMLRTGDTEALSRTLRDKRFDSALKRAFGDGAKLSNEQIQRMTDAYRSRFIAFHAETVARTATLDASKLGQNIAWQGAIDSGAVEEQQVLKRWVGVKDDREREEHLEMEGETVLFSEAFSNGEDIPGESTYNCRCVPYYYHDPEAARQTTLGGEALADRAAGIIGTVRGFLESTSGGTIDEIMTQLTTDFPERPREGMLQTVKTQLNRLPKTVGREVEKLQVEGRGKVFRFVSNTPRPVEPPPPPPQAPLPPTAGVVDTIKWYISQPGGATVDEIMSQLKVSFPERNPEGMLQTVRTQLTRLPKVLGKEIEKLQIEGRGRVYKLSGTVTDIPKQVPNATVKPLATKKEIALQKLSALPVPSDDMMEVAGLEDFIGENSKYAIAPFGGTGEHLEMILERSAGNGFELYQEAMKLMTEAPVRIITLGPDLRTTQVTIDRSVVERYIAAAPTNQLPPIIVRYSGQDWIVDGHHRITAEMLQGQLATKARYIDLDRALAAQAKSPEATAKDLVKAAFGGEVRTGRTYVEDGIVKMTGETPEQKSFRDKLAKTWFEKPGSAREVWNQLTEEERGFFRRAGITFRKKEMKSAYGRFWARTFDKRFGTGMRSVIELRGDRMAGTYGVGTMQHETGHAIDYFMGEKSAYNGTFWSNRSDEFIKAINQDLAHSERLFDERQGYSYSARLYYEYVQGLYQKNGIQSIQREIAADLIAAIRFDATSIRSGQWKAEQMLKMFPRTSAIVRDALKTIPLTVS